MSDFVTALSSVTKKNKNKDYNVIIFFFILVILSIISIQFEKTSSQYDYSVFYSKVCQVYTVIGLPCKLNKNPSLDQIISDILLLHQKIGINQAPPKNKDKVDWILSQIKILHKRVGFIPK